MTFAGNVYVWVLSYVWRNHVTYMNEPEWIISRMNTKMRLFTLDAPYPSAPRVQWDQLWVLTCGDIFIRGTDGYSGTICVTWLIFFGTICEYMWWRNSTSTQWLRTVGPFVWHVSLQWDHLCDMTLSLYDTTPHPHKNDSFICVTFSFVAPMGSVAPATCVIWLLHSCSCVWHDPFPRILADVCMSHIWMSETTHLYMWHTHDSDVCHRYPSATRM